jgi:hypothetical protein
MVAMTAAAVPLYSEAPPWKEDGSASLPGPFRGRVVEVQCPGSVSQDRKIDGAAVRAMMERGMCELTGKSDWVEAWKRFFGPGDRVAVKGGSVGRPHSITQHETLTEVVRGLFSAGVKAEDIVFYERYRKEMEEPGFHRLVPKGGRALWASEEFTEMQTDTAGYDTATYVEFPRVSIGADPENAVHRRSHLALALSREVDKIVNVCVLKDHASAGITFALKNISHGSVNNVSRSHRDETTNWCDTFIPGVVRMPALRRKVVLNIGDALIGTFDGGPGAWNPHFRTWPYGALFFATDPAAMDRIGWRILDARRAEEGLPPLSETGTRRKNPGHETFAVRQPQHVLLAGKMGLGETDLQKIEHRLLRIG